MVLGRAYTLSMYVPFLGLRCIHAGGRDDFRVFGGGDFDLNGGGTNTAGESEPLFDRCTSLPAANAIWCASRNGVFTVGFWMGAAPLRTITVKTSSAFRNTDSAPFSSSAAFDRVGEWKQGLQISISLEET